MSKESEFTYMQERSLMLFYPMDRHIVDVLPGVDVPDGVNVQAITDQEAIRDFININGIDRNTPELKRMGSCMLAAVSPEMASALSDGRLALLRVGIDLPATVEGDSGEKLKLSDIAREPLRELEVAIQKAQVEQKLEQLAKIDPEFADLFRLAQHDTKGCDPSDRSKILAARRRVARKRNYLTAYYSDYSGGRRSNPRRVCMPQRV